MTKLYNLNSGKTEATRQAYGKKLLELGHKNTDIVVMDADLSGSTQTAHFGKAFPDRFFDCGIAEMNMMGMAAGLGLTGKLVFVSTFAVFATSRPYDAIRQSICISNSNVKIAASHAGLTVGEDGASHQMIEDINLMRGLPGMHVVCPADAVEAEKLIGQVAEEYGPYYIRLGRSKIPVLFDAATYHPRLGHPALLREGSDVCLFAIGLMVARALEAAEILDKEGISARVVNVHTLKPLDAEAIAAHARECGCAVTAEEHIRYGGLFSAVAETIALKNPVPLRYVAIGNTFGESGKPDELLEKYGLTADNIVLKAREAMKLKKA